VECGELALIVADSRSHRGELVLCALLLGGELLLEPRSPLGDATLRLDPDPLGLGSLPLTHAGDIGIGDGTQGRDPRLGVSRQLLRARICLLAELAEIRIAGVIGDAAHGVDQLAQETIRRRKSRGRGFDRAGLIARRGVRRRLGRRLGSGGFTCRSLGGRGGIGRRRSGTLSRLRLGLRLVGRLRLRVR
jgi:hypothetical protein